jgi:hypothetical protein
MRPASAREHDGALLASTSGPGLVKRAGVIGLALLVLSLVGGFAWMKLAKRKAPGAKRAAPASTEPRRVTPFEIAESVYDGRLMTGWEDWGWGPHKLPGNGPAEVVFAGYGGIILHHQALPQRFGALVFRYKAPAKFGSFLAVSVTSQQGVSSQFPSVTLEPRHIAPLPDGWLEALVPWKEINPTGAPIDRIVIAAPKAIEDDWVMLDKIALTKPATQKQAGKGDTRKVRLAIQCSEAARPISPLIYGVTFGVRDTGGAANRIGGNTTTRLNWELGKVWNTGSDWFFENVQGGPDSDFRDGIDDGDRRGIQTAMVVPLIGWVAKDASSSGFPKSKFGQQRKHDPYRPEAGDGHKPDGTPIPPGPPTETSIPAPPELIAKWVRDLRARNLADRKQRARMIILDNEPALWNETHRDVHPEAVGYDELLERTVRYGTAIRDADPDAIIAGPAEWGWTNYFTSAKDRGRGLVGPDRLAHQGTALVPWYLQRLNEHERKTGKRLLDYLDVHFYPAAANVYGANARTDPEGAALRLRSTRALWDPTYVDESWIGEPVRLIPRLTEWVKENYPGRKISLGEWSFGADDDISGALATAEALGRFGQRGLDAAFFWGGPKSGSAAFWAFRAFRNYDGKGARFLDHSVSTTEAPGVSLFASRDASGSHVVAVLLNLDPDFAAVADLNVQSCGAVRSRRVFRYGSGSKTIVEDKSDEPETELSLPPYSLAVVDFRFDMSGD